MALHSKYTRALTFEEHFVLIFENFGAALISRGESTGGVPRSTGIGSLAARKWLVHVEQNGLGLKSPHIVGLFCLCSRSLLTLVWSAQESGSS